MIEIDPLVHLPVVATALGYESTRAVRALCQRFQIPVYRLNNRINAMKQSDYALLLARMSEARVI
jgi:hypothetical protein